MRLVLPVSFVDIRLAEDLVMRLKKLGSLKERSITIATCWSDKWDAEPLIKYLEAAAAHVEVIVLPDVPENRGWPDASNHMFYNTHLALRERGNAEPIYWFEADNFPITADFLVSFEKEYESAGKLYMGALNASRYFKDGKQIEQGQHMAGTGVYPADFLEQCKAIHYVPENMPWDVWIEKEVVPECHSTSLLWHAWNCGHYHIIDGRLIGRDLKERPGRHKYGGRPVNRSAVVIHGDKTSSLHAIDFAHWNA